MLRLAIPLLLAAACAASQEPGSASPTSGEWSPPGATPPAAETSKASEGDERVCHEERVTGSNLSRTVCRSKRDDDREREEAQQFGRKNSRGIQMTK